MQILELPVEKRDKLGSANARRYRRAGGIPCNLYGRGVDPFPLVTTRDDFGEVLKLHTAIVRLKLGDDSQLALLREVKWDTFGDYVEHVDFKRVEMEDTVKIKVPLVFVGTPAGAHHGGDLQAVQVDIEVMSRVDSIPSEIRVDVSALEIGDGIRAEGLPYPDHVEPAIDPQAMIVQVKAPKKVEEPEPSEEAEGGEAPAEADEQPAEE